MEKKKIIKKLIGSGIILVILLCLCAAIFDKLGLLNISKEELQNFIASTGVKAPLIYIIVTFLQVVLIPIPTMIMIIVGSYLFGPFLSLIYSYVGLILGSLVAYILGKILGRPFVNWLTGDKQETDVWMSKLKGKEKVLLFFMFLLPLFPDDILCAVAGILPITFKEFFIIQIVTRFTTVASTLIFMTGEFIPFNGWGIPVIATGILICIILFVYCYKNAEKIDLYINKKINRRKEKIEKDKNVSREDV